MNRAHDDTSEALLAAAHRLLSTVGPDALTVRRIAHEANMSTMNVYSRFGGKDGVIDELYVDGHQRLLDRIRSVPTTDHVSDDLMNMADAYRSFALENPSYYGVMFRSSVPTYEPSPEAVGVALSAIQVLVERIEAGQAVGEIAATDPGDATEIAAWLWATCHGLVSLELDGVAAEIVSWPSVWSRGVRSAIAGMHPSVEPAAKS